MNLYPFQRRILDDTNDFKRVAYYLDMGLGKTFVGAEKAVQLGSKNILVVCQKSKVNDWKSHFIENYFIPVFDLTNKHDFDEFTWLSESKSFGKTIGIINYELAWRRPELLKLNNFTLMLDESSLIQNRKAKQSKFILKLHPENVILLSGTPTSGRYENLWTQLHLLGWDISESTYNSQYVNWKSQRIGWGVNARFVPVVDKEQPYKNVERLKRKMRENGAVFLKTNEVLDLPDQVITEIKVDISKEYRKFNKDCIVDVKYPTKNADGDQMCRRIVGDTELTKRLGLRELCGQFSKEKLKAFEDLIESTNERIVVFYNFKEEAVELIKIANKHEKPWSIIDGKNKNLAAYENFDNSIVFVQYQAGSMGLNLQKSNIMIFYSLPDGRQDLFDQAMKRIHRIGQNKTCFYYILTCKDSVEEDIRDTLEIRKMYTDELFNERMGTK